MNNQTTFDVVVIGAGVGGYCAAIRASQLGLKTVIIEKSATLGGTCLNLGCIPAKVLLDTTELYATIKENAEGQGILCDNLRFELSAIMEKKRSAVERLTKGVETLMKENRIEVMRGKARLAAPGEVIVLGGDGKESTVSGKNIILSTGSVPAELPALPFDGERVVSSDTALSFDSVPERLIVIGAGAVGLETGSIWMRLGSKVTVIELMGQVLPGMDREMCRTLQRILQKQGMEISLSTEIIAYSIKEKAVEIKAKNEKGGEMAFHGDRVLVAVGRKAYFEGLGLEALNIKVSGKGKVTVNERFQTSDPNVYAVGDIVEGPMLAHKAEEEGIAAAEFIAGKHGHVNYGTIPNVVYTWPEAASVGMTEEQCVADKIPFNKGVFHFRVNARGITSGNTDGFAKILAHRDTDRVLGGIILGPWASDLIGEVVSVMEFGGSSEDIARTMHAHPTLSEAVKEAALDVEGRAIHAMSVKNMKR